jgi:hypothetical protein
MATITHCNSHGDALSKEGKLPFSDVTHLLFSLYGTLNL